MATLVNRADSDTGLFQSSLFLTATWRTSEWTKSQVDFYRRGKDTFLCPNVVQEAHEYALGDGGAIDNSGLLPLLQRRARKAGSEAVQCRVRRCEWLKHDVAPKLDDHIITSYKLQTDSIFVVKSQERIGRNSLAWARNLDMFRLPYGPGMIIYRPFPALFLHCPNSGSQREPSAHTSLILLRIQSFSTNFNIAQLFERWGDLDCNLLHAHDGVRLWEGPIWLLYHKASGIRKLENYDTAWDFGILQHLPKFWTNSHDLYSFSYPFFAFDYAFLAGEMNWISAYVTIFLSVRVGIVYSRRNIMRMGTLRGYSVS